MTSLSGRLQRIPKVALFAAAGLIQFALLAVMIIPGISCAATTSGSATIFPRCRPEPC
jgi:hypothetical protein